MVDQKLRYTKEHEWVRVEGDVATVGISDHAQEMLGDVTFVELPEVDASFKQNDAMAVVESSKAASDVYCPISGTILKVNSPLEDAPELINDSCYDEGWLCKVKVTKSEELDGLMTAEAYSTFLAEHS
jgi:glycine cleavage system H protein